MEDNALMDKYNKPVDWLYQTIDGLKMYKAPGADGISNEVYYLLNDNPDLHFLLKGVYRESMVSGSLPETIEGEMLQAPVQEGRMHATASGRG